MAQPVWSEEELRQRRLIQEAIGDRSPRSQDDENRVWLLVMAVVLSSLFWLGVFTNGSTTKYEWNPETQKVEKV